MVAINCVKVKGLGDIRVQCLLCEVASFDWTEMIKTGVMEYSCSRGMPCRFRSLENAIEWDNKKNFGQKVKKIYIMIDLYMYEVY